VILLKKGQSKNGERPGPGFKSRTGHSFSQRFLNAVLFLSFKMEPGDGYKVGEFMSMDVVKVSPESSVFDCANVMASKHVSSIVVLEGTALKGIVTEKDLARKIVAKGLDAKQTLVKDIMTTEVLTVEPDTSLYDAMVLLNKKKIKHLPVIKGNVVAGIITAMDILRVQPSYMEVLSAKAETESSQ
jgi:signal-transduction protein with cAMP-binding, CBS, and nucleotidyltransferase domain